MTPLVDGRAGLRHWGARLIRFRVGWRWYAGVLLGVPAVLTPSRCAARRRGTSAEPGPDLLALYLPMLVLQFFTTAMAEEPGWRDFALPRLQVRFGAVRGTRGPRPALGLLAPAALPERLGRRPDVPLMAPVEFVAAYPVEPGHDLGLQPHRSEPADRDDAARRDQQTYSSVWSRIFPTLDVVRDPVHVSCHDGRPLVLLVATRGRLGLSTVTSPSTPG